MLSQLVSSVDNIVYAIEDNFKSTGRNKLEAMKKTNWLTRWEWEILSVLKICNITYLNRPPIQHLMMQLSTIFLIFLDYKINLTYLTIFPTNLSANLKILLNYDYWHDTLPIKMKYSAFLFLTIHKQTEINNWIRIKDLLLTV